MRISEGDKQADRYLARAFEKFGKMVNFKKNRPSHNRDIISFACTTAKRLPEESKALLDKLQYDKYLSH